MSTTTPTIAADDGAHIANAEQEAHAAEQHVTALEDAVRQGDDTVTPGALRDARDQAGHARLLVDAVRRRVAEARETRRAHALGEVADQLDAAAAELPDIDALIHTARTAVRAVHDALTDHDQRITAAANTARELGAPRPVPGARPQPPAGAPHALALPEHLGQGVSVMARGRTFAAGGRTPAQIDALITSREEPTPLAGYLVAAVRTDEPQESADVAHFRRMENATTMEEREAIKAEMRAEEAAAGVDPRDPMNVRNRKVAAHRAAHGLPA